METFVWDPRFETGIALIDAQHRRLVALTNQLGEDLMQGSAPDDAVLQSLFGELAAYGREHFAAEEQLMRDRGVAADYLQAHIAHHQRFIEQLTMMWRARATLPRPADMLHGFLAAWLTVHILGEDQVMARQIERIAQGQDPAAAQLSEAGAGDPATAVLLKALERLYALVGEQNRALAQSNQQLEERVAARTEELAAAKARLEREQAELTQALSRMELAQRQLLQSEKMAAIGQLAAGVAHEINNPVGFVNSNLSTLEKYLQRLLEVIAAYEAHRQGGSRESLDAVLADADLDFIREDLPALLQESQDGLARVTKIVQDLKDFSHVDQAAQEPADLNAAMESTLNVVWHELKYKAEVVREYGQIPKVDCIPAQINQVFMNLLVNAAQAIAVRGKITVRSGADTTQAWFEIEDTGRGMDEAVRQHIFEPFFTTKPVGQGTGLGLSISYDIIVKRHGGTIEVRSQPGIGTCFRLTLPLRARPADAATDQPAVVTHPEN